MANKPIQIMSVEPAFVIKKMSPDSRTILDAELLYISIGANNAHPQT
jgi:hypothetical protein